MEEGRRLSYSRGTQPQRYRPMSSMEAQPIDSSRTLRSRSFDIPQREEEEESGFFSKETAIDMALFVGAGAVAGVAGAFMGPAAPVGVPLLAAGLYGGAKAAEAHMEGRERRSMTEELSGKEFSPIVSNAVALGEDALMFWGGGKYPAKIIGGASKKVLHGVELATSRPMSWIGDQAKMRAKATLEDSKVWEKLNQVIVNPLDIKPFGANRSARELFQPGIERLAKSNVPVLSQSAASIRAAEVQKRHVSRILGDVSKDITPLGMQERTEVVLGLSKKSIPKSPKAIEVVDRFHSRISDLHLKTPYDLALRENVAKQMSASFEATEKVFEEYTPEALEKVFSGWGDRLKAGETTKQIQKGIQEIIEDPNIEGRLKKYAVDMYSAPARVPKAVVKSSRKAQIEYMTQKFLNNRGLLSPVEKAGYEEFKWGMFRQSSKKYFAPRDLVLQMKDMDKIEELATVTGSRLMSMWKSGKTIARPAYHIRNLISNAILADWGGLPIYRMDIYSRAFKGMRNGSSEWKEFAKFTAAQGTFTQNDLNLLGEGLEYGSTIFDKAFHVFEKAVGPLATLQNAEENLFKFAKYIHSTTELGMSKAEAVLDAQKYLLNYGEASLGAAKLRKFWMPFATWFTKIIPLTVDTATNHPLRFGKWIMFGAALQNYAIDQTGIGEHEWEKIKGNIPEYMNNGMYLLMPWRDDKNRLNLMNTTFIMPGLGDMAELYKLLDMTSGGGLQVPNPVVSMVASLASKEKSSGAPLYFDWEPRSTQWAKIASYAWDQFMPGMAPFGTDWDALSRSINEDKNAPTISKSLMSSLGMKLTPIEPRELAKKKRIIDNIHKREWMSQFKREMRRAKNAEDKHKIIEEFRQTRPGR